MKTKHCGVCEGSGIMYVADHLGDDFQAEYCTYCPEGLKAQMAEVGEVVHVKKIYSPLDIVQNQMEVITKGLRV